MSGGKCPHTDISRCPLYIASHAGLPTCMGLHWDMSGCDVDHGKADYTALMGQLIAADPRLVAEIDWKKRLAGSRDQRDRNMRLNGVH